jgi:hypothetical protein
MHRVDLKLEEYALHVGFQKHLSLEVLQYLRSEGCELASTYYKFAALRADRAVITWLLEQGFSCEVLHLCNFAASHGSVEQIQWLVERGMRLELSALTCALREGHAAAVQFLVASGLQLELVPDATTLVARTGNLPLLQWLQEQNCDVLHENTAKRGCSQWQCTDGHLVAVAGIRVQEHSHCNSSCSWWQLAYAAAPDQHWL